MILLQRIHIKDFRSIANETFDIKEGYNPIIGLNNSGKSNLLRALNLYFTNEVEPGKALDLRVDFHNPSRNQKKRIEISIDFKLPDKFQYQRTISESLNRLLGRNFTIKLVWQYSDPISRNIGVEYSYRKNEESFVTAKNEDENSIRQFIKLIKFRYIPNHIHPSEMLKSEENELRDALIFKLNQKKSFDKNTIQELFDRITSLSTEIVKPIEEKLKDTATNVNELSLTVPTDLSQLLFAFKPQMKVRGGEKLDSLQHGSGVQSYLTYRMLHFLDTRYSSKFGWHQATIWAIEEPESFLHQSLQHKMADFFSEIGRDERFQVFTTTHNDIFARYSSSGLLFTLDNGKTNALTTDSTYLIELLSKKGIVSFVHPLHYSVRKPLLLVEGITDKRYLENYYRVTKLVNPWDVRAIEEIDPGSNLKGVDGLGSYLNSNISVLKTRAIDSPIIVVIDWNENNTKIEKINRALSVHQPSTAVQWPEANANPQLDESFTGIERFLSTSIIEKAGVEGILSLKNPYKKDYPLSLVRSSLSKTRLCDFVIAQCDENDYDHFKGFIKIIEQKIIQKDR